MRIKHQGSGRILTCMRQCLLRWAVKSWDMHGVTSDHVSISTKGKRDMDSARSLPMMFRRTLLCGHPSYVDSPLLWATFCQIVEFSSYLKVCGMCPAHYYGHFLSSTQVSTLPRFYCIWNKAWSQCLCPPNPLQTLALLSTYYVQSI